MAPMAIVILADGGWRIATAVDTREREVTGKVCAVHVFELAPGMPYQQREAAIDDAALIVRRLEP